MRSSRVETRPRIRRTGRRSHAPTTAASRTLHCPLTIVPTMDGWIVQWYAPTARRIIGALNAPGARLPVSRVPSFNTTRCVTVSTLCHTTIWAGGTVAGFGENDCAPFSRTTLIVMASAVGAGVSLGPVGVGLVGVGLVGVGLGDGLVGDGLE